MASTIDNQRLLLTIDANIELLRRNMANAADVVDRQGRRIEQRANSIENSFQKMQAGGVVALKALSGAIAAFGVAGLLQAGRSVLQFADDLETAAEQANISVERYQTLREGLRKLELTTEQTDNVLKRLASTLGEIQAGTASLQVADAVERLGLTQRILNGEISTTDELLDGIAEASSRYATEAQFTADVVAILGRRLGVDLATALRDGGEALREQEQAFRDAGAVISEEYVAKLADANETLDSFATRTTNRLVIWAADVITEVERVIRALQGISGLELVSPVALVSGVIGRRNAEAQFQEQFGLGGLDARERRDRQAIESLPAGSDARLELERQYQNTYLRPFGSTRPSSGGVIAPLRSTVSSPARAPSRVVARARAPSLRELREGGFDQANISRFNQTPILQGIPDSLISEEERAQRLREVYQSIRDIAGDISNIVLIDEDAVLSARRISSNLAEAIVFGQSIGQALVNSFKAAAAEALANGLFDLLLGGRRGGGILGSFLGFIGGGIPGRASGGPVSAGRPYIVGERRPELFVPSTSGVILPSVPAGMNGGVQQKVIVDVNPSPLFVTSVRQVALQGGAAAAVETIRRDRRAPIPGGGR